jgi:hypothetical protein
MWMEVVVVYLKRQSQRLTEGGEAVLPSTWGMVLLLPLRHNTNKHRCDVFAAGSGQCPSRYVMATAIRYVDRR